MKKLFLFACLLVTSLTSNAQYTLTPDGLQNETNKDYIIMEFPNNTQKELYDAIHLFVSSNYASPQDVLSVMEGQAITINGVHKNAIYRNNPISKTFDINYTIVFFFKDGKIRVNNPTINRMWVPGVVVSDFYINGTFMMQNGIFNRKGKVLAKKTKTSIEQFFNNYIAKIKESVEANDSTDW